MGNLDEAIDFLKKISLENDYLYSEEISDIESRIDSDEFNIAVIGEFSVGKSTFLNALMGKRILFSAGQEATGVSTRIVNSDENRARVIFLDENIEDQILDLNDNNAYSKLELYLNREKKSSFTVKGIEIEYPIKDIHKSIGILDTPGLGGLTGRELQIAKDTLKLSNMSIVVIGNQGIKDSEIQLLLGNNKEFGKVKTKETIVVINKIGEYFDKYEENIALSKIKKVHKSVENEFKKYGIENIKIFTVDSREYLWARDTDLYELAKEKGMISLSQEQYRERSKFKDLFDYIIEATKEDSKKAILFEELKEDILTILSEFKNEYLDNNVDNARSIENKISLLEDRRNSLIENRRNIFNTVKRQINSSSADFSEVLKTDFESTQNIIKKEVMITIDKINELDDFNGEKTNEILSSIDKEINGYIKVYNQKISEYKKFLNTKVIETFDNKLKLVLKVASLDISYKMESSFDGDLELKSIKAGYKEKISVDDDKLIDINYKSQLLESELSKFLKIKKELDFDKMKFDRRVLEQKRKYNENELNKAIRSLGSQPSPRDVYTYEERTKGILFWKKTESGLSTFFNTKIIRTF